MIALSEWAERWAEFQAWGTLVTLVLLPFLVVGAWLLHRHERRERTVEENWERMRRARGRR